MKPESKIHCFLFASIVAWSTTPLDAGIVFAETFETPDITGYTQGTTPTGWVRAAQGFNSSFHGLIDQEVDGVGGLAFTPPGTQGYAFRYTNSGLTSAPGVIGGLTLGTSYTVSVDVVKDVSGATGMPYTIQFLAVAPGAARDDCRSVPTGSTVLGTASGSAPNDGSVLTVTINFTPGAVTHASLLGYDLAVRFIGASDTANVDNVQVSATTPGVALWDTNGAAAGAGNPATGTWNGSATHWNATADGSGAVAAWNPGDKPFFAAGTDATDPYIVDVVGSQDIGNLMSFEEGTVTLADGGAGALNLTADHTAYLASGLSATIAPPITEDAAGRQFTKAGPGTLTLSGNNSYTGLTTVAQGVLVLSGTDNSAATGGITVNSGRVRFDSPGSIHGTGLNVTINSGGTVMFGSSFDAGNIPSALLNRIADASAGTIAADNYSSTSFDFAASFKNSAFLGAVGGVNYTGTLTPNGSTYRLGGGGGTLTMANANALAGENSAVIRGNVVLAGANNHSAGTTLNAGTNLTLGDNASLGGGTLTLAGTSTIQASSAVVATNVIAANADLTVAGSQALTLSGDMTINANRAITNNNTDATTTFGNVSRDGGNNRNLTVNGSGNTTVSGNLVLGTGTLTKNGSGHLTLEGANNFGTTTISGGRLILKGSNSSAATTTLTLNQLHLGSASNGGLPGGNVTFGNGTQFNAIIQAIDADRTIGNNLILNNTHGSISGDYSLTVNGNFTNSGGNRTLTSGIASGKSLTLAGTVNLSNDATNRSLTITGTGETIISGVVANGSTSTAGALVKSGAGTLILTNDNTYDGTTTVNNNGTLLVTGSIEAGAVTVNNTATLGGSGSIGGNVTITAAANLAPGDTAGDTLAIGGNLNLSAMAGGTGKLVYELGPIGSSDRINVTGTLNIDSEKLGFSDFIFTNGGLEEGVYTLVTSSGFTGTGLLDPLDLEGTVGAFTAVLGTSGNNIILTVGTPGGTPFSIWSGGAAANVDTNQDGVDNGVAWVLGAEDTNDNATGLVPALDNTSDPDFLIFNHRRSDDANADENTTIKVQYCSDLATWLDAVAGPDIVITPFNDDYAAGIDRVEVKIRRTLAVGGKLFARLNVGVAE